EITSKPASAREFHMKAKDNVESNGDLRSRQLAKPGVGRRRVRTARSSRSDKLPVYPVVHQDRPIHGLNNIPKTRRGLMRYGASQANGISKKRGAVAMREKRSQIARISSRLHEQPLTAEPNAI